MPGDDRALLARIAEGDEQALKCLYASYRPRLWSYLWRLLDQNPERTEEVLQDVLLAVWRHAHSYRGEAQVATWLFRIAHNCAINARRADLRHASHRAPLDDDDDGETLAELAMDESYEERVLDQMLLMEALGQLSPKHREVLELAFAQGFTAEEIAHILGVPVGTVKSRLTYARRALRVRWRLVRAAEGAG
ncbi:MAG TPA: sigma-70 family RNA polymerase sigma factor [Ktedonobacterales bacterium]